MSRDQRERLKRLRRAVRGELRRTQTKRVRAWRGQPKGWALRIVVTFLVFGIVFALCREAGEETAVHAVTAWSLLLSFTAARIIHHQLYEVPDVYAFLHLPVELQFVFRRQCRHALLGAGWLLFDLTVCYGVIAGVYHSAPAGYLLGVTTALLQGGAVLCAGVLLVAWRPHSSYWLAGSAAYLLPLFVVMVEGFPEVRSLLESTSPVLETVTPHGWAAVFYLSIALQPQFAIPALLGLAMGIPVLAGYALRRLFAEYEFVEAVRHPWADQDPGAKGPTAIADEMRTVPLSETLKWRKGGWLENWMQRWFTNRQCVVAALMKGDEPKWSALWKWAVAWGLMAVAASFLLGDLDTQLERVILAVLVGVAFLFALPVFNGLDAFQGVSSGFHTVPVFEMFPVGYWEIFAVDVKITVARFLTALPVLIPLGALAGWNADMGAGHGGVLALKICLLILVIRPVVLLMQFSSGTNDSKGFSIRSVLLLAILVMVVIALIGLGFALFHLISPTSWIPVLAGMGLLSLGAFALYGAFYPKFDVIKEEKE